MSANKMSASFFRKYFVRKKVRKSCPQKSAASIFRKYFVRKKSPQIFYLFADN